jgi:type I restriction enzyme R subunit
VLAYILYTIAPKTRSERAEEARRGPVNDEADELRGLLNGILSAYEKTGESEISSNKLTNFLVSRFGSVNESKNRLGGLEKLKMAFKNLQSSIYKS